MPKHNVSDSELIKHFEANMLDGDSVYDCGGAMIAATEVLEYLTEVVHKEREAAAKIANNNTARLFLTILEQNNLLSELGEGVLKELEAAGLANKEEK